MKRFLSILIASIILCIGYNNEVAAQYKTISKEQYYDKTLAMLVGQCGGVVTGYEYVKVKNPDGSFKEPHEQWLGLPDEWFSILNGTLGGTTRDEYNYFSNYQFGMILSDDDQHVDFMNQVILNTYGPAVAWQDIRHSWLYYDLRDFGGTSDALGLLKSKDLLAPQMGSPEHGNNGHWLPESYIQHETMGGAFPGMPQQASKITYKFSRMSGQGEPVEWGMYWAAATAIAYFETDIRDVIRKALDVVPGNSYVRTTYDICLNLHQKHPTDWRAAVREFWHNHERYVCYVGTEKVQLIANVNNANCILSCLYGQNNYMETLRIQSLSGGDAECGASTLCGILGVIHGMAGTPREFVDNIYVNGTGIWRNDMYHALHMHTNFPEDLRFDDLARIIQENAEQSILAFGGTITAQNYNIAPESFIPQIISFDNWDFEKGNLSGWHIWNSPGSNNSAWAELQWFNQSRKSTLAATGYYKATIVTSSKTAECKLYRTITGLKPGATYKIEGRINTPLGREARMYADKYGGDYTFVSAQGTKMFPFRYLYVTLGETNTSMEVGFHAPPTSTNGSLWCSFDDLVITEVATKPVVTYECENTETKNIAIVSQSQSASHGAFLDNTHLDGVAFTYKINAAYSGEHALRIFFANNGGLALFNLKVNNVNVGNIEFGDTGPWTSFSANHVDAHVRLLQGENTIAFSRVSGGVTFDKIEVIAPHEGAYPSTNSEILSGGIYIIKAKHSGMCLTAQNPVQNGMDILQQNYTGSNDQLFVIQQVRKGEYSVMPFQTNKCLEIGGSSVNNGGKAIVWDYWGGETQKWRIVKLENGYYKFLNSNSGKSLDVSDISLQAGANLIQWDYVGGENQQFELIPVGTTKQVESGQVYRIISKANGKSFDIDAISQTNAAKLIVWDYLQGTNQQYKLEKEGTAFRIKAMHSYKYLELPSASVQNGIQLQQYYKISGNHQLWDISPTSDGYFTIKNVHSGKFVQLDSDGKQVKQYDKNNLDNQKWSFEPVFLQNFEKGNSTVSIAMPSKNTQFAVRDTIAILAGLFDKMGTIQSVKFYVNNQVIFTSNSAPHSCTYVPTVQGDYSIQAVAYTANTIVSTSEVITVEVIQKPISQSISLHKGWNLISTHIHVQDSSIDQMFATLNVQMIKNEDGFWNKYQDAAFNSLKTITAGKGYLVYIEESNTLFLTGTPIQAADISSAAHGWQLIGYPAQGNLNFAPIPISDYFNSQNCHTIKNFDGFWLPNGTHNSLHNFEPGKGYFIKQ
ncbi:MAG: RICIN domain-containing protein [Bacteroidales bacterium]|nr:RICIN domain-containing protein [Bacteroidales bacterium]